MIHNLLGSLTGSKKIKGTVILMKKNVLDFNDFSASLLDGLLELVGQKVSLQLISAVHGDPANENKGKIGKVAYLENWIQLPSLGGAAGESHFGVEFDWQEEIGVPGAFIIKNNHTSQFYLRSLTLQDVPGKGNIHFACDSWVYPASKYKYNRIFFTNETSRVDQMPEPLRKYREEELAHLRGTGTGELKEYDRVYDYAYYNDLGDPDSGNPRQILGGSKEFPYPRRGRTGRAPTKTDPNSESRLFLLSLDIYVPRDERFGHLKMSDFLAYALKSLAQGLIPSLDSVLDPKSKNEFDTFEEVLDLYDKGIQLPGLNAIKNIIPWEMIKEIVRTDGEGLLKFPVPQVIKADKSAWRTDQEFGREMLAGVNPVIIQRLQVFPPTSNLDPIKYGDHTSSITAEHIVHHLGGLTVEEAIAKNRLYILDHHDALMLYLTRINKLGNAIYASRTILFLQDDGTLKPLVIELSLPHPSGEQLGAVNKIFTPASTGVEGSIWELAKAYVAVADSGVHQLISHWLNTHAVIEPFVIATNRQLSVVHPIYKLLQPHYRDTMNINALARQILINAGGVLESTVFPGQYAMEMSAVIYKSWVLTDQGLPADLLKRGVAVPDSSQKCGVRLLIEDYPYAVDGLEIWSAIDTWVKEYCSIYYPNDEVVKNDIELQAWWKEIREVGHGDKKDEPWWPTMQNINDLTQTCTTIIWVASALHAAVNFGQYPYAGYLPNRPTISRRFMPEPGTSQYEELKEDPEKAFLRTITSQLQTVVGVSLIEILSRHSSDEVYLGQRHTLEWTSDSKALDAFTKFGDKLRAIETNILQLNNNEAKKNRVGPVKVPYTLLYPNTSDVSKVGGLTGKGVPNSISI